MKAMQVNTADQGPPLTLVDLPTPKAGLGEILVHVHAAGVTPTELLWYPTTHAKSGTARMRAVPGHEFSGVVMAMGGDVEGFEVGDEVLWHERLVRGWGHRGILYYAARERGAEARDFRS